MLNSKIIRNVLFPFHEFLKGHKTLSYLKELEKNQWCSPEELIKMQIEKLKEFTEYIDKNVSYYHELFSELNIHSRDINRIEDIQKIPFLTKDAIRNGMERLVSSGARGLNKSNTGGSTGSPLIFYLGGKRISADVAAKMRATRWWGVDIGDPEIVIWGSPVELTKQDRIRSFRDWMFKTHLLSAFEMDEGRMTEYLSFIREFRPKHVFGYPSSINLLCRFARKKGIKLSDLGVKVVFVTAEKLYDYQREYIQESFNCKVANGYGGRDSGFIAHECPEGGMHITAENIVVEVVDSNGICVPAGESGEIVVTQLYSHDFPFMRYRTGDIGIISRESCSCGRGLPLLKEVEGRTTDFIVTRDGRIMHGLSLIYILRDIPGIEEFKIIQEDIENFEIQIVPDSSFNYKNEENIRTGFKNQIGESITVRFVYPEAIKPEKSGKFRYVVSKVATPYL